MSLNPSKLYAFYLFPLFIVFCLRVLAQLLQIIYPIDLLPAFDQWQSGAVPYSVLLIAQILIICISFSVLLRFYMGKTRPSLKWGKVLLGFGSIYAGSMLIRLFVGVFFIPGHSWFGAYLPTFFHLVLSSFVLIWGHYHYRYANS